MQRAHDIHGPTGYTPEEVIPEAVPVDQRGPRDRRGRGGARPDRPGQLRILQFVRWSARPAAPPGHSRGPLLPRLQWPPPRGRLSSPGERRLHGRLAGLRLCARRRALPEPHLGLHAGLRLLPEDPGRRLGGGRVRPSPRARAHGRRGLGAGGEAWGSPAAPRSSSPVSASPPAGSTCSSRSRGRLVRSGVPRVRLDTDGLANLREGRDVTPDLAAAGLGAVVVSLNAPDAATYLRLCPNRHGEAAWEAVREFIRAAVRQRPGGPGQLRGRPRARHGRMPGGRRDARRTVPLEAVRPGGPPQGAWRKRLIPTVPAGSPQPFRHPGPSLAPGKNPAASPV